MQYLDLDGLTHLWSKINAGLQTKLDGDEYITSAEIAEICSSNVVQAEGVSF